ncbi:MAG: adenylosuccinate lyase [Phycisphaeraceae bacterium]|nr:adenylosuccinate lyase [Phycisphaeraceae bacterium]MBX3367083.1 adenylosuccinate lyase [Phycisphaeraceae bacterium]
MTSPYDTYTSPLASRNASPEMLTLWSARHKFNTWRKIWLAVAEAQHEMTAKGAPSASSGTRASDTPRELVTREQVEELRAVVNRPGGITDGEIQAAEKYERELRHDVMAHVHALGDSCPKAKGIIHLGMTSQDVVCNADVLIVMECIRLIEAKAATVIISLGRAAQQWTNVPTLGFTHYQPAQPLTVGRRAVQWGYDLSLCLDRIRAYTQVRYRHDNAFYGMKGLKGATGTQASFLSLMDGRHGLVDELEELVLVKLFGDEDAWDGVHRMTSQTYPRVSDTFILADLASIASVLHKIATDIRLLCNRKEIDEPFEEKQIGSSAMPYKRNPMRCERICGLTRFVMNLVGNAYDTAATQWLERTLDDSSNRRLSLPEAFLALDGALDLMHNVASGLIVHEATVRKNLMAELPFMATENILMACVKLGGDRQHYHELIRQHAQAAGLRVKQEGLDNDLLDRLQADKNFWSTSRGGPLAAELDWDGVMDPMKYVGRSVEQTERFIKEVVEPLREQYADAIANLGASGPKV